MCAEVSANRSFECHLVLRGTFLQEIQASTRRLTLILFPKQHLFLVVLMRHVTSTKASFFQLLFCLPQWFDCKLQKLLGNNACAVGLLVNLQDKFPQKNQMYFKCRRDGLFIAHKQVQKASCGTILLGARHCLFSLTKACYSVRIVCVPFLLVQCSSLETP